MLRLYRPRTPKLNPMHPLARGLVAAWLIYEGGGDNVFDLSPKRRSASINGSPTWFWGGIQVSANNQYISNSSIAPPVDDFSATVIVADPIDVVTAGMLLRRGSDANSGWSLDIYTGEWRIRRSGIAWITTGNTDTSGLHIATVLRNGGLWEMYLDGNPILSPTSGTLNAAGSGLFLGSSTADAHCRGDFYTMMYYDRVLATSEIRAQHIDPFAPFRPVRRYFAVPAAGGDLSINVSDSATISESVNKALAYQVKREKGDLGLWKQGVKIVG